MTFVLCGVLLPACADRPREAPVAVASAPATARSPLGGSPTVTPSRRSATLAAPSPSRPVKLEQYRTKRRYRPVAAPVTIRIPAAKVNASIERLGVAADGTIAVPKDFDAAGWYAGGPRPGQPGPAVILGHVDSRRGPAVFFHVSHLRNGAKVYVDRADGSTATFRVTRRLQTPKKAFPTDEVYAPTLEPGLRLVTCGGTFDTGTGHYRDNVVVFAEPA